MPCRFEVKGPFEVRCRSGARGNRIEEEHRLDFWKGKGACSFAGRWGCYVFAVKAGRGTIPWYVGRTIHRTFGDECLSDRNLVKYNGVLFDRKGTPRLFLVVAPAKTNEKNKKAVRKVEKFLITEGKSQNPELLNKIGTAPPTWDIQGIFGSTRGRPSNDAKEFIEMMRF